MTYEDLHVMDGSVVHSDIGTNPSLIISALAFRTPAYIRDEKNILAEDNKNQDNG